MNGIVLKWAVGVGMVTLCGGPACVDTGTEEATSPARAAVAEEPLHFDEWPCTQNEDQVLQFRTTLLQMRSPAALAAPLFRGVIESAVDSFALVWLLELNLASNSLKMGSGLPFSETPTEEATFCSAKWNPVYEAAEVPVEIEDHRVTVVEPIPYLELPIYVAGATSSPRLVLPLRLVDFAGLQLSNDGQMIGEPGGETEGIAYSSSWQAGGILRGWVDVEEAKTVPVFSTTLCAILAGPSSDSCRAPRSSWNFPPSPIPGTDQLGYLFESDLGAGAVDISALIMPVFVPGVPSLSARP